jgi:hypothetical protein
MKHLAGLFVLGLLIACDGRPDPALRVRSS